MGSTLGRFGHYSSNLVDRAPSLLLLYCWWSWCIQVYVRNEHPTGSQDGPKCPSLGQGADGHDLTEASHWPSGAGLIIILILERRPR